MGPMKIMIGYTQIVTAFPLVLDVQWPEIFTKWTEILNVVNIDLIYLIDFQCVDNSLTFYTTLVSQTLGPAIATVFIFGGGYARIYLGGNTSAKDTGQVWIQHTQVFLLLIFVTYPSVCTTILTLFRCEQVDNTYYLMADMRIECYEGHWNSYAVLGAFSILVYPFGVPTLFGIMLYCNRNSLFPNREDEYRKMTLDDRSNELTAKSEQSLPDEQDVINEEMRAIQEEYRGIEQREHEHKVTSSKYGFVYSSYADHAYYWELTELVRKLLLTGVVIFVAPGSLSQLAFAFLVTLMFFVLHIEVGAFPDPSESNLMFVSLLSVLITVFCGIIIKGQEAEDQTWIEGFFIKAVLLVSNGAITAIFVYLLYTTCRGFVTTHETTTPGEEEAEPQTFEDALENLIAQLRKVLQSDVQLLRTVNPILGVLEREGQVALKGKYRKKGGGWVLIRELNATLYEESPVYMVKQLLYIAQDFGGSTMNTAVSDSFFLLATSNETTAGTNQEGVTVDDKCDGVVPDVEDKGDDEQDKISGKFSTQKEQAATLFETYDLDASGTVNTTENVQQITFAILCKLDLKVDPTQVQELTEKLTRVGTSEMDFEGYWEWFTDAFNFREVTEAIPNSVET